MSCLMQLFGCIRCILFRLQTLRIVLSLSMTKLTSPFPHGAGNYFQFPSASETSSGHRLMTNPWAPGTQAAYLGEAPPPSAGQGQSQGRISSQGSSANPQPGQMANAPSSHFVSSGSFDFGGRAGSLGTTGLLPNLGSQPLELSELELENASDGFGSPGGYPRGGPSQGLAGRSGRVYTTCCLRFTTEGDVSV